MNTRIQFGLQTFPFLRTPSSKGGEALGFGTNRVGFRTSRNKFFFRVNLASENGEEEGGVVACGDGSNHGVQRYLLSVEYIGTGFSGSQWQPNHRTVVGVLQDAFQNFIGKPVPVFCSSRTDAGVHALSNVCHADVERISKRRAGEVLPPHDPQVVRKAVNHFLQKDEGDIRIVDVRCVPASFHARFNAQNRT